MPGHAASGMIVANRLRLDICSLVAGITVREGLHALPTLNDQHRRWAIFAITAANFFLSQFYRATNAVIAPQLTADLRLDTADLGFLSAAFFYAFALTQIPISIFLQSGCSGTQLAMGVDQARDGDDTYDVDGISYVIETKLAEVVGDMKLDYLNDDIQQGFMLSSSKPLPQPEGGSCGSCSSCGC